MFVMPRQDAAMCIPDLSRLKPQYGHIIGRDRWVSRDER